MMDLDPLMMQKFTKDVCPTTQQMLRVYSCAIFVYMYTYYFCLVSVSSACIMCTRCVLYTNLVIS